MSNGQFRDVLNIDGNGRITPSGPLELGDDEEIIRLYAWVIQAREDGTAGICVVTASGGEGRRWRASGRLASW